MNRREAPLPSEGIAAARGRGLKITSRPLVRSVSLECPPKTTEESGAGGILPSEICPADEKFLATRLNDITSYFFLWFCKKYRIRIGPPRDLGGKDEVQTKCPICLDACTKSIELQCGHSFCRSCLTRSAANNMTSCALCRREQEINPKLLRARFDEQRMINLAQRLAIPPPLRSRPPTSAAPVSASEGMREEKEEQLRVGSSSSAREMLVQYGDVGAISADDLRRRWKLSGLQAPTAAGGATVGAESAAKLRASWRALEDMSCSSMCMQNGQGACARASSLSCSADAETFTVGSRFPAANIDSSFAGEISRGELSLRWTHLQGILLAGAVERNSSNSDHATENESCGGRSDNAFVIGSQTCSDVGSLGASHLRKRWHEAAKVSDVGGLEARDLSLRLTRAFGGVKDVGGLAVASLQRRWHGGGQIGDAGNANAGDLPFKMTRGVGGGGDAGGLDASCVRKRWREAEEISDVGGMGLRDLASRMTHALDGTDDIGGSDACYLRERWHGRVQVGDVGEKDIRELSIGLTGALGAGEDVGGLDTFCLRKRWHEATEANDVGAVEFRELNLRLAHALDDQSAGDMPAAKIKTRWEDRQGDVLRACANRSLVRNGAGNISRDSGAAWKPSALDDKGCAAGQKSAPVG